MKKRIKKVAILGSGIMGSGIAAHLANAGIRSYMLDIVPAELTEEEKAKGYTLQSPAVRNRIADANKAKLIKSRPALLMDKKDADLITTGNMEDNLEWLNQCDWIIEVVPENLKIKKEVLKRVSAFIKAGTFVSSNTSSISIDLIAEDMPESFRKYWLGTHFFNPVRYMRLLEIIPGKDTLPELIEFMADFGERVLGKGIVYAKDTPAFVANRLGNWVGPSISTLMLENGLTVSEVDAITGSAIGRPGTGSFGLFDLVGLDIAIASTGTVRDNVSAPAEKQMFSLPAFCEEMQKRGMLGNKTRGGFYKKQGKEKFMVDVNSFEYVPIKKAQFPSVDAAKKQKDLAAKLKTFFEGDDTAAKVVWEHLSGLFLYAASKIPEISENILNMDRALCWGYNFAKGPFEMWNGLDLPKYIARMEKEGKSIPDWIKEMLAAGVSSFYKNENGIEYYYSIPDKKYLAIAYKPDIIIFPELKGAGKVIKSSASGTIYDIGDGVICLELHSRASAIDASVLEVMKEAQEELYRNWEGMVITSRGKNFCVGADLQSVIALAEAKKWDEMDSLLKYSQDIYMANKYSEKPVVVAPYGRVLGGGCEITIQSSAIQALGETYIGLVEVGVGLIPAGGGIKEMTLRAMDRFKDVETRAGVDFFRPYYENIVLAKVSMSAKEAKKLYFMRPTDGVTLNPDYLLKDAKNKVLALIEAGYLPPVAKPFPAMGQNHLALLKVGTHQFKQAGIMSEYDWHICCRVVDVMAGGSVVSGGMINEQYLLDLEREVFISLTGQQKTQDRIKYMLAKGKPLRN